MLDLLSLASDNCAERAWRLMKISPEEGAVRRDAIRLRVDEFERYRREHDLD